MNQGVANAPAVRESASVPATPRENLGLIYQEVLTAITRLRANRQAVADVETFRKSMTSVLAAAEADATRKGYTPEDSRLATFAVVSLLDESVKEAEGPQFADWAHQSMMGELFGQRTSEDIFFQCIDRLLARGNSPEDADLLEVFGLCLLLGYRGAYRARPPASVRPIINTILEKVQNIRGVSPMAPDWIPRPDAVLRPPPDPWVRALVFGAIAALFLAFLFFAGFKIVLASRAAGLHLL